MGRKRYLPPSPLAPRQLVKLDVNNPAAAAYLTDRLDRLARGKRAFPSEFDRLLAPAEAWSRAVYAEAGMKPDAPVSEDLYPQKVWYASQIRSLAAEIRTLREKEPDLVLGIALTLGELIGEAKAHLSHGENAARGLKAMSSAREGHEQVHGSKEAKEARWHAHVRAFERHRAKGHSITTAQSLAAEECGVSCKSIFNARTWARAR